jgi:hypothetical protein
MHQLSQKDIFQHSSIVDVNEMIREQELLEKLDTSPMIRSQWLKSTLFNQSQSMRFTTQDLRESDDFTL